MPDMFSRGLVRKEGMEAARHYLLWTGDSICNHFVLLRSRTKLQTRDIDGTRLSRDSAEMTQITPLKAKLLDRIYLLKTHK